MTQRDDAIQWMEEALDDFREQFPEHLGLIIVMPQNFPGEGHFLKTVRVNLEEVNRVFRFIVENEPTKIETSTEVPRRRMNS